MRPWRIDRRHELEGLVESILQSEEDGSLSMTQECESVDFKEEAGRRIGSSIEPGTHENPGAATKLADEVACFANTPGGGALIVGVEDRTGVLIGTELDVDWLRQRIFRAVDVAPDIRERRVGGQRLLVIFVSESPEPITDTGGRIRWRIGDSCERTDRSQWWEHRSTRLGYDPLGSASTKTMSDVTPRALALIRDYASSGDQLSAEQLLRRIGALRSDGYLTAAAELVLTPLGWSALELTALDVPGGRVLGLDAARPDQSLLEQLERIEDGLSGRNHTVDRTDRFAATPYRLVPPQATREAILNGLIHRDWNRTEATDVRWVDADSTLIVRSPGGFTGGVSAENVLSNRHARYPALADLFRALGMVEKQGLGVDRMYQAMIVLGHRPPRISEVAGPNVECVLTGGDPALPVIDLVQAIRPIARQTDFRVAIIVYLLLREPFVTGSRVATELQADLEDARDVLRIATETTVDDHPLIARYKDVWMFGTGAWRKAIDARTAGSVDAFMGHASTAPEALDKVTRSWFTDHAAITSGDLMTLTGVSRGTARAFLDDQSDLHNMGAGRNSRYEQRR